MTYVIAVCHQKGGVAKTTTVLALGAALAEQEKGTLIVDLDAAANLTAGVGMNPFRIKKSAADLLLGVDTLADVTQPTGIPRLEIVPANRDIATASQILSVRPNYEQLLRKIIHRDANGYDYVLFDCPPSLGALPTVALAAANLAIIPTQCEYFSLQALNSVFKLVNKIRALYNSGLHYRLLVTMFDRRGGLHTDIFEKMQAKYENALFETEIGFDSKLRASQIAGIPVTDFASSTRASHQYRALASEIMTYVNK